MNISENLSVLFGGHNVGKSPLVHEALAFSFSATVHRLFCYLPIALVGTSGLEPPTSRLSAECSSQLSYVPMLLRISRGLSSMLHLVVEMRGIEPLTPCLQGRCAPS